MNMEKATPSSSMLLTHHHNSDWIKCEDALPSDENEVLVVAVDNGDTEIRIGFYSLGAWYLYTDDDKLSKVTYWMPLPELPED